MLMGPIQYSDNFRTFTITILCLVALCPVVIYIGVQNYLKSIVDKMREETIQKYNTNVIQPVIEHIDINFNEDLVQQKMDFRNYFMKLKIREKNKFDYIPVITFLSGLIQIVVILLKDY